MLSVRALTTKIINLCVRAVVTRSGERYQAQWLGDRVTSLVEHFQPQGLHFRVPVGAEAMLLAPCGETSAAVLLGAHKRSTMPKDTIAEGEGGLHYSGIYCVFVDKNLVAHLGGGIAASDFIALAGKVGIEFTRVSTDILTLKQATSAALALVVPKPVPPPAPPVDPKAIFDTATAGIPTVPVTVAAQKAKAT